MPTSHSRSLFTYVRSHITTQQAIFRSPKATLVDISHALEDAIQSHGQHALLFAGFQQGIFWKQEETRYTQLAATIETIVVLAQGHATIEGARHIHISLASDDPLCREWFVLTINESYAALLAAIELDQDTVDGDERMFDAICVFDADLIAGCVALLLDVVETYQPAKASTLRHICNTIPPRTPQGKVLSDLMALLMRYSRGRQERLQTALEQQQELRAVQHQLEQTLIEVAVPVIPLVPGVLVMPLVGTIDTRRSQQVMEALLEGISTRQADVAILDITGVPLIDTTVANNLIQAVRAARLLGAQVIFSGIGADIAQTLVHLEIDFSQIHTCATLQEAISVALALQGLKISEI